MVTRGTGCREPGKDVHEMSENSGRIRSEKERDLWVQFDALQLGTGWDEEDIGKLQILVEDVYGDSPPGRMHLNQGSDLRRMRTGARRHEPDPCLAGDHL